MQILDIRLYKVTGEPREVCCVRMQVHNLMILDNSGYPRLHCVVVLLNVSRSPLECTVDSKDSSLWPSTIDPHIHGGNNACKANGE